MIAIRSVSKLFGEVKAVDDATLEIPAGEKLAIVGPSGSGKTTLLRLVAGLETPDTGEIVIDGSVVSRPGFVEAPHRRRIGMVFQQPALWPHMTVAATVGFGLTDHRSAAASARIDALLSAVGLEGLGRRRPHELSGGEAQRVALARALAPEPAILLLDEPFSGLDDELADSILDLVHRLVTEAMTTVLYVSHDKERGRRLCDQIAVMAGGRIDGTSMWDGPEVPR